MNSTSGSVMFAGEFTIARLSPGHAGFTAAAPATAIAAAFARSVNGGGRCDRLAAFGRFVILVGADPVGAVLVGAVEHIGAAHGFHFLRANRVHDSASHAGADHHRDEGGV